MPIAPAGGNADVKTSAAGTMVTTSGRRDRCLERSAHTRVACPRSSDSTTASGERVLRELQCRVRDEPHNGGLFHKSREVQFLIEQELIRKTALVVDLKTGGA